MGSFPPSTALTEKWSGIALRMPTIKADAATWAAIQEAGMGAVMTDPAAREHLFGPELRKIAANTRAARRGSPVPAATAPSFGARFRGAVRAEVRGREPHGLSQSAARYTCSTVTLGSRRSGGDNRGDQAAGASAVPVGENQDDLPTSVVMHSFLLSQLKNSLWLRKNPSQVGARHSRGAMCRQCRSAAQISRGIDLRCRSALEVG